MVYTPVNQHAFISDYYKVKPITFFNPRQSPLLDHYRLKVPRIRSVIEYVKSVTFIHLTSLAKLRQFLYIVRTVRLRDRM